MATTATISQRPIESSAATLWDRRARAWILQASRRAAVAEARDILKNAFGYFSACSLLSEIDANQKVAKSDRVFARYLSRIMHFAPAGMAGAGNVCEHASDGCLLACLNSAGIPFLQATKDRARIARTKFFAEYPTEFLTLLIHEMHNHRLAARRAGRMACFRLNGTSDVNWPIVAPQLFDIFSDSILYDYTKDSARLATTAPQHNNYFLTFSLSESNEQEALEVLERGGRVAMVTSAYGCSRHPRPIEHTTDKRGYTFVDADKHDLIFKHRRARRATRAGMIQVLRHKGKATKDTSGFVKNDPRGFFQELADKGATQ